METRDDARMYHELVGYLDELTELQGDVLAYLRDKHELIASGKPSELEDFAPREENLIERLKNCQHHRARLLTYAAPESDQDATIASLAEGLPDEERHEVRRKISGARQQGHLVQQQMLSQWVAMQRSMIHLAHLLEIIATGGRSRPTYGKEDSARASGSLVDQAI